MIEWIKTSKRTYKIKGDENSPNSFSIIKDIYNSGYDVWLGICKGEHFKTLKEAKSWVEKRVNIGG